MVLRKLRVTRMHVTGGPHGSTLQVELDAEGCRPALEVIRYFTNHYWLDDLDAPYLDSLLAMRTDEYGGVSLREDGWAALEADDPNWVRVSDSYGDERCALVAWDEFEAVMRLKRQFLCLRQRFADHGVPRYSATDGFRVRLHAPGCGSAADASGI